MKQGTFLMVGVFKGLFLLVCLFFAFSYFGFPAFAQSANTELEDITNKIQEAILRGATEAELDELKKTLLGAQISESVDIKIVPEHYGPNENVEIRLVSYQTDLRRARITWYSGNTVLTSGLGATKYAIKTRGVGERTALSVTIRTYEGFVVTKNVSLVPVGLDLHWEASAYVPPFYKGKALPSPRSTMRFVALPEFIDSGGKEMRSSELVYTWRSQNGTIFEEGYGKNTASFLSPEWVGVARPVDIEVSSLGKSLSLKKRFYIESFSPVAIPYEENPLLGILYNRALKEVSLLDEEISIRGEPFFFSAGAQASGDLVYEWGQNGKTVPTNEGSGVVFRREGEASGSSRISFSVENPFNVFERSSSSFLLKFGK